jgi:hypothetical protein
VALDHKSQPLGVKPVQRSNEHADAIERIRLELELERTFWENVSHDHVVFSLNVDVHRRMCEQVAL